VQDFASLSVVKCCTLQLFKGTFYYCDGPDVSEIRNKSDCMNIGPPYRWTNRKYNFDNLGQVRRLGQHNVYKRYI